MVPNGVQLLADALAAGSLDPLAPFALPYARAFVSIAPTVTLVPALSPRGLPASAVVRSALIVALVMPVAAAFGDAADVRSAPAAATLLIDLVRGMGLALAITTPLWVAAHVGALADTFRGTTSAGVAPPPGVEGANGPLATLTGLLAAATWLATGGVVRALALLMHPETTAHAVSAFALAARALTDGLRLGIAAAAGLVIVAAAYEVLVGVITRASAPLSPQPVAQALRPLVSLVALAALLPAAMRLLVPG